MFRIAWFSPLRPVHSGIAAYSAELLPQLGAAFVIDSYPEGAAHDFVWRARREPYDLVVYHLGNAPCHDYMWAYLARYPGLVVLHDARLHHARARRLLLQRRFGDYLRELRYDHPEVPPGFVEYAVAGFGGPIYYFWPMVRVVLRTARTVVVHNARVASDLRETCPGVPIETIRMGVPKLIAPAGAREEIRSRLSVPGEATLFAAFGKITAEKRVTAMLDALEGLNREGRNAYLMLVGDGTDYPELAGEITRRGMAGRVRVTGHVPDDAVAAYLAAADACLCLRWPTALETSASWLRCLAAGRPTVITDLAHLADTPPDVALRVDLADEAATLHEAMRQLADDGRLRRQLEVRGHAHWAAHHTLEAMADDYRRVLALAVLRAAPQPDDLPGHFLTDYSEPARSILRRFQLAEDVVLPADRRLTP